MLRFNRYNALGSVEALQIELSILANRYKEYLEQEAVEHEVQCLRNWIDDSYRGHLSAMRDLEEHGSELLGHVRDKLHHAASEIQRMDEESPNARHFSGGKADRLNKAAIVASRAFDKLKEALPTRKLH